MEFAFFFLQKRKKLVMSVFRSGLFSGKVAIVTGGGTGIGKAIATELLHLGKIWQFFWYAHQMFSRIFNISELWISTNYLAKNQQKSILK